MGCFASSGSVEWWGTRKHHERAQADIYEVVTCYVSRNQAILEGIIRKAVNNEYLGSWVEVIHAYRCNHSILITITSRLNTKSSIP
jgi:hypothetical protein